MKFLIFLFFSALINKPKRPMEVTMFYLLESMGWVAMLSLRPTPRILKVFTKMEVIRLKPGAFTPVRAVQIGPA
jgi:hypothetical protein